jgi:glycogen operon protein
VEGPTDDPAITALRERQKRNMLATLLLSQGTPMVLAGDESGRTQQGNNNAYCQDNDIGWVDWNVDEKGEALRRFVLRLTALRREYPILRRNRFFTGEYNHELDVKDVSWINANGGEMTQEDWDNGNIKCFGMLMDGRAQTTGIRQRGLDATLLLVVNSWQDVVEFKLPEVYDAAGWTLLLDTNQEELEKDGGGSFDIGHVYQVTGRSLLLFARKPAGQDRETPSSAPTP